LLFLTKRTREKRSSALRLTAATRREKLRSFYAKLPLSQFLLEAIAKTCATAFGGQATSCCVNVS